MRNNAYRWKVECEARCPALAVAVTSICGRKFQLCRHHKNEIDVQLAEGGWQNMDSSAGQEEELVAT